MSTPIIIIDPKKANLSSTVVEQPNGTHSVVTSDGDGIAHGFKSKDMAEGWLHAALHFLGFH